MTTSDKLIVTFEEGDFIEAYRPAPKPRRLARLMLGLAVALALLIAALLIRFPAAGSGLVESPLTTGLFGAIVLPPS